LNKNVYEFHVPNWNTMQFVSTVRLENFIRRSLLNLLKSVSNQNELLV